MRNIVFTHKDLLQIKDMAKNEFRNLPGNLYLSNKKLEENEVIQISLANAIVSWLNHKELMNGSVSFDYTDHSNEFDGSEE
jgi:hypothetical protein